MEQARDGQVVTFYSFKGGTGRTMALANVAWILAASGKRVLAVDWDLESPGLPRYYSPFLPAEAVRDTPGVIDLIREFDTEAVRREKKQEGFDDIAAYARVGQYAMSLNWKFPDGGTLDYMSCGRQNMDYATTIGALGWDSFYDRLHGGRLFTALRADMKANYDYTLIDSRTGLSDIASICTVHLPDTLVNCFTLNTQGIEGAVRVAADVAKYRVHGGGKRIRMLPVPMRVENTEKAKADAGHSLARRRFDGLPADLEDRERDRYWTNVVIPYQSYYNYEEILATFGDERSGPTTLLGAYERLTGYITEDEVRGMPPLEPGLREYWLKRFERTAPSDVTEVVLDHEPPDDAWAEWVERVLGEVRIRVHREPGAVLSGPAGSAAPAPMVLSIVSRSTPRPNGDASPQWGEGASRTVHKAIYVADMRPLDQFPVDVSQQLAGQSAAEAAHRLTRLIGCDPVPDDALRRLAAHYPGNEPAINNAPVRNSRFTGRAEPLRRLRDQLREQRVAAVLPLTLNSGIGKTQLALEYVHRYRSEYEVVWWIQSGQPQFVNTALVDLGSALTAKFGTLVGAGAGATAENDALAVVDALGQGRPVGRWLLVFDNANDAAAVSKFVPGGEGHVLITSRERTWDQFASTLDIDVFPREESIAHLRQRAPEILEQEADALAQALGDLPLALALTGAWLQDTATPVAEHLRSLEQHGPLAVPEPLLDYPETLVNVLDNSLERVRAQSKAAHRLLQLCSCMSGESIALGLIYSQAMVSLLVRYDPTLTESNDIARHVQQLNRLALIKLDNHARQFQIHRLLQSRARQQLTDAELQTVRHEVHTLLAANRPRRDVDDPVTWPRYRMLWPHLEQSEAAACQTELVRTLMIDRVRYLWLRGELAQGAQLARAIEGTWSARLDRMPAGDEATTLRKQLLHLQFNLANILRDLAQYDESFRLDTQALAQQRELLGDEHRHTLMTSTGVGADLRALGRYGESVTVSEETYQAWNRVFGEDFGRTLDAANNLAVSYRLAGRYAEALRLDAATYERRRTTLGELHPRTIGSASAIGRNLRETGQYARSVSWLRDVLATAKSQNDLNPRALAALQVNLAASLRAAGRHPEAVPVIEEAYRELTGLLGEDHPETLICRVCHCAQLLASEEYERAHRQTQAVRAAYRRVVGPEHPLTLVAASNHVAILRALPGQGAEALDTARETVDGLRAAVGPDHSYLLAATMNLAVCLADAGRLDEALALDMQTAPRMTALLGAGHPDTLRAEANLAITRDAAGERGARDDLERLTERLAEAIGREHPSVLALQRGNRAHRVLDPQPF